MIRWQAGTDLKTFYFVGCLRHTKIASETHRSDFSCCSFQPQSPGSHLRPHTGEQLSLAAPLHSSHVVVNGHCWLIPQHGNMVKQKARTHGVASVRLGIGSLQSTCHPQVSRFHTWRTMLGMSNLRLSSVLIQPALAARFYQPGGNGIKLSLNYSTSAELSVVNTGHGNIQVAHDSIV